MSLMLTSLMDSASKRAISGSRRPMAQVSRRRAAETRKRLPATRGKRELEEPSTLCMDSEAQLADLTANPRRLVKGYENKRTLIRNCHSSLSSLACLL